MDTLAIANEHANRYKSFEMGGETTSTDVLRLFDEYVEFSGPFTFIKELALYTPGEELETQSIDPDRDVIVYDTFGPHGVCIPEFKFHGLEGVRKWIEGNLEPKAEGEYVIGQGLTADDFETEGDK